jgi:glycosyltransferase involved in cell wall biosynthesis
LDLYQTADCYIQPSVKEGWGLAVLEAMANGLPVVASNIPVFREYLVDSHNALLADPEDHHEIARQMIRAVRQKELAMSLSANGKLTARQYTWSMAAGKHIRLYERMLNNERVVLTR